MRGLAEFIMRGRWQALAVAILGSGSLLFGWISAAAVALVTLRKGGVEGGWLVFWALLPAAVLTWITGDAGSLLLLAGTYGVALILRESVSLSLAVLATVPMAVASGVILVTLNEAFLQSLVTMFNEALGGLSQELEREGAGELAFRPLQVPQVAALLAAGNAVMTLLSVLLGRYWQAVLYNPGGFGREFRALRLPRPMVLALVLVAGLLWWFGPEWAVWAAVVVVPLTAVWFALLHAYAARAGKGSTWLALMYTVWIVLDPAKWLAVACVAVDAFMDIRARWAASQGSDPKSGTGA
jgi:hypothetical protein